ncbi:hypothetical protein [Empedobacter falsenii]
MDTLSIKSVDEIKSRLIKDTKYFKKLADKNFKRELDVYPNDKMFSENVKLIIKPEEDLIYRHNLNGLIEDDKINSMFFSNENEFQDYYFYFDPRYPGESLFEDLNIHSTFNFSKPKYHQVKIKKVFKNKEVLTPFLLLDKNSVDSIEVEFNYFKLNDINYANLSKKDNSYQLNKNSKITWIQKNDYLGYIVVTGDFMYNNFRDDATFSYLNSLGSYLPVSFVKEGYNYEINEKYLKEFNELIVELERISQLNNKNEILKQLNKIENKKYLLLSTLQYFDVDIYGFYNFTINSQIPILNIKSKVYAIKTTNKIKTIVYNYSYSYEILKNRVILKRESTFNNN